MKEEYREKAQLKGQTGYEKIIKNLKVINNDNHGILSKIKKLKRMIINKMQKVEDVEVYYSEQTPLLMFSYSIGRHKHFKNYKNMRQMLKEVPQMSKKH